MTYLAPALKKVGAFLFSQPKEDKPLKSFRDNAHRTVFLEASRNMNRSNYALLAALYLLTADSRLWNQVKDCVHHNTIPFDQMEPKNHSTNSYALFSVAKDLYLGTNHMSLCDLADTELIPPKIFVIICNSMAIYRLGLDAIKEAPERKAESSRKE
jgi:hypothetical protein